jgi:hypothetical protein
LVPWALYLTFHPRFSLSNQVQEENYPNAYKKVSSQLDGVDKGNEGFAVDIDLKPGDPVNPSFRVPVAPKKFKATKNLVGNAELPVVGPVPTEGTAFPLLELQSEQSHQLDHP